MYIMTIINIRYYTIYDGDSRDKLLEAYSDNVSCNEYI